MESYEKIIKKFNETPGLCSLEELEEIKIFFIIFKENHDLLIRCGYVNFSDKYWDSILDKIEWYINYRSK